MNQEQKTLAQLTSAISSKSNGEIDPEALLKNHVLHQSQTMQLFNNNYTPDIEQILENIRRNSIMLSKEHHNRYLYLRDTLKFYRIPIIVISSFSSIVSMGQQFIPQDTITILNTVLSFVCSVIGAIELFMQVSQQMVQEKSASSDYYILASDIYKCLTLEPRNRTSDGKTFLEEKYGTYVKLVESSTIVRKNIKDQLCDIPKELKFQIKQKKHAFKSPFRYLTRSIDKNDSQDFAGLQLQPYDDIEGHIRRDRRESKDTTI